MFVELIDLLRCPRPHEESWLVASAEETVARHVVRGTLGCPVCHAEYPIANGVADFGSAPDAGLGEEHLAPDDAMRVAALFGLTSSGGAVVLGGAWHRIATALAELTGVRVIALDPHGAVDLAVSALRGGGGLPIAPNALRGVVLDAHTADAPRLAAAVRALGAGARLVAPAAAPMPTGLTELARDARQWVAERVGLTSQPITLRRRTND